MTLRKKKKRDENSDKKILIKEKLEDKIKEMMI